jgi:hypothetical protein
MLRIACAKPLPLKFAESAKENGSVRSVGAGIDGL